MVAVEPNEGMRKGFERMQHEWKLDAKITVLDGSATSLPFEDKTFNAVYVAQVKCCLNDRPPLPFLPAFWLSSTEMKVQQHS